MGRDSPRSALWLLSQEARALLTRLRRVKAFALQETMVPAAAFSTEAQIAVEGAIDRGRHQLEQRTLAYLAWLDSPDGRRAAPADAQRRFTFLRLRFNAVLSHLDIFSEAMSQRSEAETGVWLAGLDVAARDALVLPGLYEAPPVVCYLARGPGAAIRRARTRLPGGDLNPVAIIRVPRERMIGSGIASSLVHEVGHQGAALLDLVTSVRAALDDVAPGDGALGVAWTMWKRWLSEIVADLWSVSKVGVTATAGLVGVVSLPAAFVFRESFDDPHPTPYMRVKLSAAFGKALFPDPQWDALTSVWESFYPTAQLAPERRALIAALERTMPVLVERMLSHRPAGLKGRTLPQALGTADRQPARLKGLLRTARGTQTLLRNVSPSLAFAAIGQGRADGTISPEDEGEWIARLLRDWALRSTLETSVLCADTKIRKTRLLPAAEALSASV
jgi:hypothetical protein